MNEGSNHLFSLNLDEGTAADVYVEQLRKALLAELDVNDIVNVEF